MSALPNFFPSIGISIIVNLTTDVEIEEVKGSLFNIGGLKALGVDDFPACFYQNQGAWCSDDIFEMVVTAFHVKKLHQGLNNTLISLISLCHTLYKVIYKVNVARLRPLLPNLISPNEASFVPRRHITDNILMAQEILHKFRNSKGKKGFLE